MNDVPHTDDTNEQIVHLPRASYEAQILFVRTTRCQKCGSLSTVSELFACDPLATGGGRHLFPATHFAEHLPLEKIALPVRTTPICHQCTDSLQPVTDRESYARWQDTLKRKREEMQREAAAARAKAKKEPTLEDLI